MAYRHTGPFHELGIESAQQGVLVGRVAEIQRTIPAIRKHLRSEPCFRFQFVHFHAVQRLPDDALQIVAPTTQEFSECGLVQLNHPTSPS